MQVDDIANDFLQLSGIARPTNWNVVNDWTAPE